MWYISIKSLLSMFKCLEQAIHALQTAGNCPTGNTSVYVGRIPQAWDQTPNRCSPITNLSIITQYNNAVRTVQPTSQIMDCHDQIEGAAQDTSYQPSDSAPLNSSNTKNNQDIENTTLSDADPLSSTFVTSQDDKNSEDSWEHISLQAEEMQCIIVEQNENQLNLASWVVVENNCNL